MGLHKLTAGDGYTYLTRQVAVHDSTEAGAAGLGNYYAQRGESPGRWFGAGLAGLDMSLGDVVTVTQMAALFGAGRHPNAQVIAETVLVAGGSAAEALAAGALGRPYPVYDGDAGPLPTQVADAFRNFNVDRDRSPGAAIPAEQRAWIRTEVARALFVEEYGRPAADARELSGFIARSSRPATMPARVTPTCTPMWRFRTRCRPWMGAGSRWTVGSCTRRTWRHRSGTTPGSRPS